MRKVFAAGVFMSVMAFGAYAEELSGTISDSHCGAKHTAGSEKDTACVNKCVQGGADPVFVTGGKVMKIDNPDAVKGHEGHKVTITGNVSGESIHVDSVKM